jgi:uncharacterized protein YcgI (DUF1989 family)
MRVSEVIFEHVIQPGTGKAVEMRAGQILRIEQVEGGQCVDFNCFNLNDYKEFMHCGRTRTVHGFHPSKGTFLWSGPPREHAMMFILEDTSGRNDVLFPRCSAYLYESAYGFRRSYHCQDIQAEAQREYGLTPDDVHDSFTSSCARKCGPHRAQITRQSSRAGDYVDLLALMDVLAVTNVRRRRHADQQFRTEANPSVRSPGNGRRARRSTADADPAQPTHPGVVSFAISRPIASSVPTSTYRPEFRMSR